MSQHNSRAWIAPAVWVLLVTALLGSAFMRLPWAFVDLYNNFYKATVFSWPETFRQAFGAGVEYRPLTTISIKLAHQLVGLRAWCYQALVLLQFAAVLLGLVWVFQPPTRTRAMAACVALACVVGLHTSRILFVFMPLNVYSVGVVLLLASIVLALSPRSRLSEWAFVPLTLVALLLLESGALIVAVTLVLWRMKAPGASGRAVIGTAVASLVYLAVRFGVGAQQALSIYTETGLGFDDASAAYLNATFAHAPWILWIYNVVASLLTVAASEPRAGKYLFVEALLHGHVPYWMYVHVMSSVLTTALVGYAWVTGRVSEPRDRHITAAGLTLVLGGSALGFLYTRDRIGLFAGVGYAMLVYVAVAAVLERLPERRWGRSLANALVAVLAAGWLLRTGEAYLQLRDAGWENYQEWTTRYEELGGPARPQTDILTTLRQEVLERPPVDPRDDPAWTYAVFERKFERTFR